VRGFFGRFLTLLPTDLPRGFLFSFFIFFLFWGKSSLNGKYCFYSPKIRAHLQASENFHLSFFLAPLSGEEDEGVRATLAQDSATRIPPPLPTHLHYTWLPPSLFLLPTARLYWWWWWWSCWIVLLSPSKLRRVVVEIY